MYVCDLPKQVIISVSTAGYTIIVVISDDNVHNQLPEISF